MRCVWGVWCVGGMCGGMRCVSVCCVWVTWVFEGVCHVDTFTSCHQRSYCLIQQQ